MEGLFRGTWYRSEVKLNGDKVIPMPPFELYNPFDRYKTASESRQGERSLYLEFLGVDSDKPEEVVSFCRRFGVLGDPTLVGSTNMNKIRKYYFWRDTYKTVLEEQMASLDENTETSFRKELRLPLNKDAASVETHLPNELCLPLPIMEFKAAQSWLAYCLESPALPIDRKSLLELAINTNLATSGIAPNLKWDIQENKWGLVWLSNSLIGYFWVMFLLDTLGPGKILSCPHCQGFFVTDSNRMKYCSPSCYENHKVKIYQRSDKGKETLAARKQKKSKTTKSATKKK